MGLLTYNNILHTQTSPGIDAEGLQFIAQEFYEGWVATIMTTLSNACTLQSVAAYSLDSDSAPIAEYVPPEAASGAIEGDPLPLSAACVVTLRTANRGRSGRGRVYLAAFSEADSDGSLLSNARVATVETAFTAFRAALAVQLIPLCVLSQFTNGAPRATGLLQNVIAHDVRNNTYGSQRRRNRRA